MAEPQNAPEKITRREAIRRVSIMLGGTSLVGGSALLEGCASFNAPAGYSGDLFSANDIALLDEIADTILPATDTPGAKAAEVGTFIAVMVTDTYYPEDQAIFRDGLEAMQAEAMSAHHQPFQNLDSAKRLALVTKWDREQYNTTNNYSSDAPTHPFRMMKQLTLLGYFTSEIGYTQAMRYIEVPGRFDPCVEMQPGETVWAPHA